MANINPEIIWGDSQLAELVGIKDPRRLKQLRAKGLPYYKNPDTTTGHPYAYNVRKVIRWMDGYLTR